MIRVLLIVPLAEEFDEVVSILKIRSHARQADEYLYDLDGPSGVEIRAVVLGEAGPTPAAHRTERLIGLCNPDLIVVTGIAGALSDNLGLGDVVVAEEIDHYLANSKAVDVQVSASAPQGFELVTSGRSARTSHTLLQSLRNFRYAAPELFDAWAKACEMSPQAILGKVACGDTVGDSKAFVRFLKTRGDRKYLALEMESSGVAEAATARTNPLPLLIVRGISDLAIDKDELENQTDGRWRRTAVRNAIAYVAHLLQWKDMLDGVTKRSERSMHDEHVAEVKGFIEKNQ